MFTSTRSDSLDLVWLHRFVDLLTPLILLYIIATIFNVQWHDQYIIIGILGGLLFTLSSQLIGTYQISKDHSLFVSAGMIIKAWLLTWAILIIIAFLLKESSYFSRLTLSAWAIVTPIILFSYHALIRIILIKYLSTGRNTRTIVIIGAGGLGQRVASAITHSTRLGYKVVAFFDDNSKLHNSQINNIPVLDDISKVTDYINNEKYDEVYICLPLREDKKIRNLLNELTDTAVVVKYIPDLFSFDLMHSKWTEIRGIPVFSIFDAPINNTTSKLLKKMEDIIVSILILILISPILLTISIIIKFTSSGPIIFRQTRYGLNGKEIEVYKFRSMIVQDNGSMIKQAIQNDIRITPFGAFLRKTSLDELPQFVNVIQGRMSIVGPRPHAVAHNEEYRKLVPKYMQRHLVKPGITGWAQINGYRGETDTLEKMQKRVEFDLHYINSWSIWLDIKIIFMTIFKGFLNKNAY